MPIDMVPRNVQSLNQQNQQNAKRQEVCHLTLTHLGCSSTVPAHLEDGIVLARHGNGVTAPIHLESGITALTHPGSNLIIDPAHAHLESSIKSLVHQRNCHIIITFVMMELATVGIRTQLTQPSITDAVTRQSRLAIVNGLNPLHMPGLVCRLRFLNRMYLMNRRLLLLLSTMLITLES